MLFNLPLQQFILIWIDLSFISITKTINHDFHFEKSIPVVTRKTSAVFRKLLKSMSLSLNSLKSSYKPFHIFIAVGSLQLRFRISPMNSSNDMCALSASCCTLLFMLFPENTSLIQKFFTSYILYCSRIKNIFKN